MPDQLKPVREYARDVSANLARGDSTEHTHRTALKILVETLFQGTIATNEPQRTKAGAPDYIISSGPVSIGYIEAKDVGKNLREIEKDEQLKRYRACRSRRTRRFSACWLGRARNLCRFT